MKIFVYLKCFEKCKVIYESSNYYSDDVIGNLRMNAQLEPLKNEHLYSSKMLKRLSSYDQQHHPPCLTRS